MPELTCIWYNCFHDQAINPGYFEFNRYQSDRNITFTQLRPAAYLELAIAHSVETLEDLTIRDYERNVQRDRSQVSDAPAEMETGGWLGQVRVTMKIACSAQEYTKPMRCE